MSFAGFRLTLGYDRVVWEGLTAGLKLGYQFGGLPSTDTPEPQGEQRDPSGGGSLPVHLEARLSYLFLLESSIWHPFVQIAGGMSQSAASTNVAVCDTLEQDGQPVTIPYERCDGQNARRTEMDAYRVAGNAFVGFGPGLMIDLVDNFAIAVALDFQFKVPTFGFVLAPSIFPVVMF
jgi:hypothetical protein